MECCSDVHRHQDSHHCLADPHNHLVHQDHLDPLVHPFSLHSSFLEVLDHLEVHLHNEAFVEAHLVAVVHLYCYTSCVAEVPLEDAEANSYQEPRLVLQAVLHQVGHCQEDHRRGLV